VCSSDLEIARTSDVDAAAVRAFGRPVSQLFAEWEEDLRSRLMFAPVGLFALGLWLLAAILLVLGWARRKRQGRATMARWAKEDELRHRPTWGGGATPELGNLGLSATGGAAGDAADSPYGLSDDEVPSVEDQLVPESDVDPAAKDEREDAESSERDPKRPPRYWN
jgi:hypothetical protein